MAIRAVSVLLFLCISASAQNIFTIAGIPYSHRNAVDGQPALSAPLDSVYGLMVDKITGRLLFDDESLVLRLEPDWALFAVVGTSTLATPAFFFTNLSTPSNLANLLVPGVLRGMAQDSAGALYLSDAGKGRVYRIAKDGSVTTFVGGGTAGPGSQSDGGPATAARLQSPRGLVFDSKGNLDVVEVFCNCIRQITPDGTITTLYTAPPSATRIRLPNIEGLTIDAHDNLYFTDWFENLVVKVAPDGSATPIAGTVAPGFSGDGGPASGAQLNGPSGVVLDVTGNIYVADTMNNRVRRVAPDGTITTIAGIGTCGFSGDGGPALAAELCRPAQIICDSTGDRSIADYGNRRVRKKTQDGTITT